MNARRQGVALAGSLMALSLLVACGSSSGHTATSGSEVNLGLIGPLTGTHASAGQGMVQGASMALSMINASGGLLGNHVTLVPVDDANDPADAVPAADKLIQINHVRGIVGPTSYTASTVLPIATRARVPMLMWGGGNTFDKIINPFFFRMTPSDSEEAKAMLVYARSQGWTNIALAIGDGAADQALATGIVDNAAKLSMHISANVTITSGATSFRSEIQNIFARHPQAVLAQFDTTSAGILFSELKQQGLTSTPWVGGDLWNTVEFYKALGAQVVSSIPIAFANAGANGGPGVPAFLAALKAKTGATTPSSGQQEMWDATTAWALGAELARTFNAPALANAIVKIADGPGTPCGDFKTCSKFIKAGTAIEFEGAASAVNFDRYHNVFGPFDILKFSPDGSIKKIETLTPQQIQQATAG